MFPDLYATSAQVLPVLMLALLWESRFLERIQTQPRRPRSEDPVHGVRFWTRRRVGLYAGFVATTSVAGTALAVLVLAGVLPDAPALRVVVCGCILLALATLLTRTLIDIAQATAPTAAPTPTPSAEVPEPRSTDDVGKKTAA
ncbi:hypothetical protein [Micromonospora craniellae]|uniref:Uncharacterized protein n=1 Tax=Micromonospora craniellae TaxID=2294034 RepID=A0A372FXY0_9ACTN|nr:hypothetical protein [Micromonospora craniellae]QOC93323.1 hypothetical protein ID554_06515 [Micromonospora craniellae]RFS45340.1 hypothetical protein D0Q02_16850 [Micromonospora craniellae]